MCRPNVRSESSLIVKPLTAPRSKHEASPLELKEIGDWANVASQRPGPCSSQRDANVRTPHHEYTHNKKLLPLERWLAEGAKTHPWVGIGLSDNIPAGKASNGRDSA